jgi:hypothetical protein
MYTHLHIYLPDDECYLSMYLSIVPSPMVRSRPGKMPNLSRRNMVGGGYFWGLPIQGGGGGLIYLMPFSPPFKKLGVGFPGLGSSAGTPYGGE